MTDSNTYCRWQIKVRRFDQQVQCESRVAFGAVLNPSIHVQLYGSSSCSFCVVKPLRRCVGNCKR